MLLLEAVEKRRKFLQYQLWSLGVMGITGDEPLAELERLHDNAKSEKGNLSTHD